MKRFGRWSLGLIFVGLMTYGIVLALLPRPVEVDLAEVRQGNVVVTVDEDGKTRIRQRYTVASPVGGLLERIELRPGDGIVDGSTTLATIDPGEPPILDERQVSETQARVSAAAIMIDRAKTQEEQARVAKQLADTKLARAQKLITNNGIAQSEYDDAEAAARFRAHELEAAEFNAKIAQFEYDQAAAALMRITPDPDKPLPNRRFLIQAPVDGVVLRVFQESATVVTPGTPLLEVGNPRDLEIVIDVLSTDAVRIRKDAPVSIEQWGGDYPLQAAVRVVEPSAFTKISALGVEEQRVNVIADFRESADRIASLADGFRVEAKIVIDQADDVLVVPSSALFREGKDWFVFVDNDGVAEKIQVRVGLRNESVAQILDGLQARQKVIEYPSDQIAPGVALRDRADKDLQ